MSSTIRQTEVRLGLSLNVSTPEVLTDADTYYSIGSAMTVDNANKFTGTTFTGSDGARLLFVGASQGSADKICEITYALFVNGVMVVESPLDMVATGKLVNFSATRIIEFNNNDTVEIKIKSDIPATTYTFTSLEVSFTGF